MNFTQYAATKIAEHSTGTAPWTLPSGLYLGLFSTNPTDAVSGNELSGNGYARKEITFGSASGGVIANDTQEDFAAATGSNWATATHWVLFDAATGGNGIWYGALETPQTIEVGQQFRVRVGDIVLTVE